MPHGRRFSESCRAAHYAALRRENADALVALDFPGYAIGGLAVGESHETHLRDDASRSFALAADKPRYLMGVGKPEQLPDYVRLGIDMMDCVLPTRSARHGCLFTSQGRLLIKNTQLRKRSAAHRRKMSHALSAAGTPVHICGTFIPLGESLAAILNTHHNIYFYLDIMRKIREAIRFGKLERFRSDLQARLK